MATTTSSAAAKPANGKALEDVIEALRGIQGEVDQWRLADALLKRVPDGVKGFDEIIDKAAQLGLSLRGKPLKWQTLRQYRDSAKAWPQDKRIADVSFTAHREAQFLPGDNIDAKRKLIEDVRKNLKPGETITADKIRRAVAVKAGRPVVQRGGTKVTPTPTGADDTLADLKKGGRKLIDAIGASTSESDLDKLTAGLNKVIAHVEALRMKAGRAKAAAAKKAQADKATPAASKPAAPNGASKAQPPAKRAGNIKGL